MPWAPNARGEPRQEPQRGTSGGCWRRLQCVVRFRRAWESACGAPSATPHAIRTDHGATSRGVPAGPNHAAGWDTRRARGADRTLTTHARTPPAATRNGGGDACTCAMSWRVQSCTHDEALAGCPAGRDAPPGHTPARADHSPRATGAHHTPDSHGDPRASAPSHGPPSVCGAATHPWAGQPDVGHPTSLTGVAAAPRSGDAQVRGQPGAGPPRARPECGAFSAAQRHACARAQGNLSAPHTHAVRWHGWGDTGCGTLRVRHDTPGKSNARTRQTPETRGEGTPRLPPAIRRPPRRT